MQRILVKNRLGISPKSIIEEREKRGREPTGQRIRSGRKELRVWQGQACLNLRWGTSGSLGVGEQPELSFRSDILI